MSRWIVWFKKERRAQAHAMFSIEQPKEELAKLLAERAALELNKGLVACEQYAPGERFFYPAPARQVQRKFKLVA